MARRFEIEDTITRRCIRFNPTGMQLTARVLPHSNDDEIDRVSYFLASVNDILSTRKI